MGLSGLGRCPSGQSEELCSSAEEEEEKEEEEGEEEASATSFLWQIHELKSMHIVVV